MQQPPPQNPYPPGAYPPPPPPQQPPAPYWIQPYPNAPPPQGPTDGKATTSLVLGIVSLVCSMCYMGFLFGIPAIILGVMSRREIARSGGAVGGGGVALGGIITGAFGAFVSLAQICLVVGMMIYTTSTAPKYTPTPMPPPTVYPTYTTPTVTAPTATAIAPPPSYVPHVTDLHATGGALRTQLAAAYKRADLAKKKLLVMTSASWSKEAGEVASVWSQYQVQDAVKDADVVRIDVDEFKADLKSVRMDKAEVPWFFLVGSKLEPDDAISADEWGANTAYNIAPVMRLFVHGMLKTRKTPAPAGTTL